MDNDKQHGHGHAAWTWTSSMDMDMDFDNDINMFTDIFTFFESSPYENRNDIFVISVFSLGKQFSQNKS
jgi:hypothetical protein